MLKSRQARGLLGWTMLWALLCVLASACGHSTSSIQISPSASAAAHAAEQRGLTIIEKCTPNGKAMIGSVVNKTATGLTYAQVFKTFKTKADRAPIWACAGKQAGAAQVPGTSPKVAMETCFAKSPALTAVLQHPFHAAHHLAVTVSALLNAGAVCVGTEV